MTFSPFLGPECILAFWEQLTPCCSCLSQHTCSHASYLEDDEERVVFEAASVATDLGRDKDMPRRSSVANGDCFQTDKEMFHIPTAPPTMSSLLNMQRREYSQVVS